MSLGLRIGAVEVVVGWYGMKDAFVSGDDCLLFVSLSRDEIKRSLYSFFLNQN